MHGPHAIKPMEGTSLAPAFTDTEFQRGPIYWEHEGNRAVREGRWKLVARHKGDWELYDLVADRTESNDMSDLQPDRVERMKSMYTAWAERCGVEPWPLSRRN